MSLDHQYRLWAKERSETAREALYAAVRAHVMRYARDEEVAQNVCLTLLSKLESFAPQDDTSFTRYVTSITTKHRLKAATAHTFEPLDEVAETPAVEHRYISTCDLSPFQQKVAGSILSGNSLKETAEAMGIKQSTIRQKLFRLRNEKQPSTDV